MMDLFKDNSWPSGKETFNQVVIFDFSTITFLLLVLVLAVVGFYFFKKLK